MTIRVVIADDHPVFRRGLRAALSDAPEVTVTGEVTDGVAAIAAALENRADVILRDLHMPGMTGIEVLERMHGDQRLRQIPVIIYSAAHDKSLSDQSHRLGARAYVVKGAIGVAELLALVAEHATAAPA